jgi:hypothetical protein
MGFIVSFVIGVINGRKHRIHRAMPSFGILCRVALVRTDVSEVFIAFIIRAIRISELGLTLAVTSKRHTFMANAVPSSPILTLMMEALNSSETSVLTIATWRSIPEDANLDSDLRENLKSYIALTG